MITNRIRLTPSLREKLNSSCTESEEALFLISLRLKELVLLVPLKQKNILLIRNRMALKGPTAKLKQDLADQHEQIQDLLQLAEDWFNLAEIIAQQPSSLGDLSEPIKRMLRSLGLEIDAPATTSTK